MPKSTGFDGIETGYPDLADVPASSELMVTVDGSDYNVTFNQVFDIAVLRGLPAATAAELAAQLDAYITGGGGGGSGFPLLDEDDFASNSATGAPSQQSTKAYVDAGLGTKAASSHSHTASEISDSTAAGRAILTAADVAAQKTILNPSDAETVASVNAAGGVALASVDDLDTSAAGALYETALIASTAIADGDVMKRNGAGLEGITLGTAAFLNAIPTGAPTAAASASGTIALDFTAGVSTYGTTTTENITTVNVTLTAYQWGQWIITQSTARNITFPAGTVVFGNGGALALTGVSSSRLNVLFYMNNTELWAIVGDAGVVGS